MAKRASSTVNRVLPHDTAAERSILAAIILQNDVFRIAAVIVEPGDFYHLRHRLLFRAADALQEDGRAIDLITLADALGPRDLIEVGDLQYITALTDGVPHHTNVEHYAHIVKEKARLRNLIHAATKVVERAYEQNEDADTIADAAHEDLALVVAPETEDQHRAHRVTLAADTERIKRAARRLVDAEERPAVVFPLFQTLRERLARPVVATPWRIDGWQPRGGRIVLAAQYKAGKTTLRDNYIRSKVDGDLFLGRAEVTPITGTLVVIDLEMSDHQLDAWLRAQRIHDDDRVIPIPLRGMAASFNLLDDDVRREWAARLKALHAEDLVLDCLRPVLDALGLDEQREAGQFLVAFDALLVEAGIPEALVIHHMGHNGERSRGDSRLRDWPDAEWRLVRKDEAPNSPRYITAYGRDVDIPESQLVYDSLTRHLTIEDGSRQDADGRDVLADVCSIIRLRGPLSTRGVYTELLGTGHSRPSIDKALARGVQTGVIQMTVGPRLAHLYSATAQTAQDCAD